MPTGTVNGLPTTRFRHAEIYSGRLRDTVSFTIHHEKQAESIVTMNLTLKPGRQQMSWTQLSEHLHRWTDTCNVYCVTSGDRALLIDAGSGEVLDHLADIGVTNIDWVLHTHHHRDQCWGTNRLRAAGAKVAVPEHERYLFEDAELFWRHKRVYDNYNNRNTFFAVAEDIPVDAELFDYETFTWEGIEFEIVPAKGHTHGSSMFVAQIDGRTVAFTGDLMQAGGILYQYHSLEYGYGGREGVIYTLQSAQALRKRSPDLALPSHGDPIDDPVDDCHRLEDGLMAVTRLGGGTRILPSTFPPFSDILPDARYIQVSRHLLWSGPHTVSNFYVILSESGKACFVDYGHSYSSHMGVSGDREDFDTMRFIVHHLDELRDTYGVTEIDLVLITHIHDDHTVGIPYLQRHEGAQAWALDEVAQVLASPAEWSSTPCTLKKPIEFSRVFTDGDTFSWEEYEFEIHHAPGQTEFHSVIAAAIDGRKVAFTGDNVFADLAPGMDGGLTNQLFQTTVLRNSYQLWMHQKCADVMDLVAPDLVCPGHRQLIPWDDSKSLEYRDYINRGERVVRRLTGESTGQSVDLFWARLRPYLLEVAPGAETTYTLMLRNNFDADTRFEARLLAPGGWETSTEFAELTLASGARGELQLTATAPSGPDLRRILTAEIRIDGVGQGPIAEAVVTVRETA
jgi:glyoxylase-like metal-dependent hydrolase (beta-lactamase superfamily II)